MNDEFTSEAFPPLPGEPPVHPSIVAVMRLLPPRQAELYRLRMETTPPRTIRECARLMKVGTQSTQVSWSKIKTKLGWDPIEEAKKFKSLGPLTVKDVNTGKQAPVQNVSPDVMLKLLETRIFEILQEMGNEQKLKDANLRDLSAAARDMIGQRALLRGEPTQILRVDQRQNLMRLMPSMFAEMKRRGYTMELDERGELREVKRAKTIEMEPIPRSE